MVEGAGGGAAGGAMAVLPQPQALAGVHLAGTFPEAPGTFSLARPRDFLSERMEEAGGQILSVLTHLSGRALLLRHLGRSCHHRNEVICFRHSGQQPFYLQASLVVKSHCHPAMLLNHHSRFQRPSQTIHKLRTNGILEK